MRKQWWYCQKNAMILTVLLKHLQNGDFEHWTFSDFIFSHYFHLCLSSLTHICNVWLLKKKNFILDTSSISVLLTIHFNVYAKQDWSVSSDCREYLTLGTFRHKEFDLIHNFTAQLYIFAFHQ